jgi:hypothetical protein
MGFKLQLSLIRCDEAHSVLGGTSNSLVSKEKTLKEVVDVEETNSCCKWESNNILWWRRCDCF